MEDHFYSSFNVLVKSYIENKTFTKILPWGVQNMGLPEPDWEGDVKE